MKKITLKVMLGIAMLFSVLSHAQFTQGFETGINAGWTVINGGDANTWAPSTFTPHTGTGTASIVFGSTAHADYLVSPAITVTAGISDRLTFWGRSRDPLFPEQIDVLLSNTLPVDTEFTTTLALNVAPVSGTAYFQYSYDLTAYIGQTVYIAFYSHTTDEFVFDIDDVVNDALPSCAAPLNVVTSNLTDMSVDLSWDPVTGTTGYEYVLDTVATDPVGAGTVTLNEFYSASGLIPSTVYFFHVRANCGLGGLSGWSTISFSTQATPIGCLDGLLYPADTFTPDCDGVTENIITDFGYAGEFSNVTVTLGQVYTFMSGNSDFITISTDDGATAAIFGYTPLNWTSTVTGVVRFYSHIDAACGEESVNRTRSVICGVQTTDEPDYANLQYPTTLNFVEGNSGTVYGQVYEAGLTDVAPNIVGQAPGVEAWIGISPIGNDSTPDSWTTYIPATWNAAHVSNNDEYMASIGSTLLPGTYYYAYRYRLNNGPFVYGGIDSSSNGGFWDGTTYLSGVLTITAAPIPANDECAGSISMIPGTDFASGAITTNNYSATTTAQALTFSCQTTRDSEVWYSVIVPATGVLTIETNEAPGSPYTDSVISVFSGTCGALTEVGCNDDGGTANFSLINLTGQTPGTTLYIGVWKWSNAAMRDGAFQLSVYDSTLATAGFDAAGFSAYPNPLKDFLNLSYSKDISNVAVFNLLGQEIMTKTVNANQSKIDMSNLAKGTYLVKVTADNQVKTIKVIKE